jgi:hypothetical protein
MEMVLRTGFLATLVSALLMLAAVPAMAQDMADEDYVSKYFGSSLIIFSATQLADPAVGWWGDKLPESLRYDNGYLAGMINARRIQNGVTPLLEPTGYNIAAGYEMTVDGGFEYNIDFIGIRPSEAELVLTSFGGASAILPGTSTSWRPLRTRNFSTYSYDSTQPLVLNLGVASLTVNPTSGLSSLRGQVEQVLRQHYGPTITFDLYYSQYSYRDGTSGADVSVYAEIPDPNAPAMDYSAPVG